MKGKGKPAGSSSREKVLPPRPRPEFSTDFVDREKYRLSETEMIQRKAALQSKHRQQAIEELQERRKKLEMGIIDADTRRVYETALTSKNIDLNPTVRRNLSQMIQYEKERQRERGREEGEGAEGEGGEGAEGEKEGRGPEQYEKELKEAQAFIKKFERAKKMDKIERAVNLLTEPDNKSSSVTKPSPKAAKSREKSKERRPVFENACISNNMKESCASLNTSTNEEILSNIEDTIRFMEERLFSAGRVDRLKKEHKERDNLKAQAVSGRAEGGSGRAEAVRTSYSELPSRSNQSLSSHELTGRGNFDQQTLEISQLRVKEESDEENDCLDTIRRMKEMIDLREGAQEQSFRPGMKENIDFGNKNRRLEEFSTVQKLTPHHAESDAEIDFSLTMNNSEAHALQRSERDRPNPTRLEKSLNEDDEYERIKKSLFEEVNRLQLHSIDESERSMQAKTHSKAYEMIDESSIAPVRAAATPSPVLAKARKGKPELERLKSEIRGTQWSVEAIKVEAGGRGGEVIGMDFRGSFNIKKNVIAQQL